MTRLEPAGEPSMEDILASIRKIIAEDPPGSRALPDVRAEPAAPSVTDRIFQRLGEPARNEPAKPAVAAEPYLRSSMPALSSAPVSSPSVEVSKPFDIDAQMAEVLSKTRGGAPRRDVEPSFAPVGDPVVDPVAPGVQAALDSLLIAPNLGQSPAPQPRPGFTVARDGFVPGVPEKSPLNAPGNDPFEFSLGPSPFAVRSAPKSALETSMPEVRDTRFQDFGTFVPTRPMIDDAAPVETQVAAKPNEPGSIEARVAEEPVTPASESGEAKHVDVPADGSASSAPSPEAIAAQLKDFETAITAPGVEPVSAMDSVETVLAELKSKLDQAAEPEKETHPVSSEPEPAIAAAPVEADMANPEPAIAAQVDVTPEAEAETEAESAAAAPPVIETSVADIVEIVEPAPIAAPEMVRELEREFVRDLAQEMVVAEPAMMSPAAYAPSPFHATQVSAMQISAMENAGLPGARSMEDTVAELLRPMLRSWLAENMPKIVERALRKEIDDSLHSEHKTAAE